MLLSTTNLRCSCCSSRFRLCFSFRRVFIHFTPMSDAGAALDARAKPLYRLGLDVLRLTRPRGSPRTASPSSIFSDFPLPSSILRREHHMQLATFDPRRSTLHHREVLERFGDMVQHLQSLLRAAHFTAAVTDGDLHLVALLQELPRVFHLEVEIMGVRARSEFQLLDVHGMLALLRLLRLLLLFVLVLPVSHGPRCRGSRVRRVLDQAQAQLLVLVEVAPSASPPVVRIMDY